MLGRRCWVAVILFGLGTLGLGCGDDDAPPAAGVGGGNASGGTTGVGGSNDAGGASGSSTAPIGPQLALSYGSATATIDLGKLPTQTYKDEAVVPLSAIWEAGKLGKSASELVFDFEGDDGFRPTTKPKCPDPVAGADLDKGYLLPATRTLVWDDSLGFAGCYGVKALKTIIAIDP